MFPSFTEYSNKYNPLYYRTILEFLINQEESNYVELVNVVNDIYLGQCFVKNANTRKITWHTKSVVFNSFDIHTYCYISVLKLINVYGCPKIEIFVKKKLSGNFNITITRMRIIIVFNFYRKELFLFNLKASFTLF